MTIDCRGGRHRLGRIRNANVELLGSIAFRRTALVEVSVVNHAERGLGRRGRGIKCADYMKGPVSSAVEFQ
jgi:hypothetical protein